MFWSELKMCANCLEHFFLSEELVSFVTTTNSPTDKPSEYVRLLANFYVYKSELHGSMPVLRVFHTDLRSRYNIQNYAPFMLGKRWLQNAVAIL